jgi:hypothetical protein
MLAPGSALLVPVYIAPVDYRSAFPATSPPHGFPSQLCILGSYVLSIMKMFLYGAITREFEFQHKVGGELFKEVYMNWRYYKAAQCKWLYWVHGRYSLIDWQSIPIHSILAGKSSICLAPKSNLPNPVSVNIQHLSHQFISSAHR